LVFQSTSFLACVSAFHWTSLLVHSTCGDKVWSWFVWRTGDD
jgi:hypothetical protein